MKRFLIHATYKPSFIGVSVPFAEFFRQHVTFIIESRKKPTLKQIEEAAKYYKVYGKDFTHCATTEVHNDYKEFGTPTPVQDAEEK
jgi:hypothetical protein